MFFENIKIQDVKQEIGAMVRAVRKKEKITQQELAEKLALSRITIQHLEAGRNFTIDTLLKVLEHFEMMDSLYRFFVQQHEEIDNVDSLY
jgi:transcriptional regulator with XRE-family HTH domain